MKKLKGCLSIIVLLMAIGALGSIFGKGDGGSSNSASSAISSVASSASSQASSAKKEESKTYGIGQVVKVGDVEYTVNSVTQATTVGTDFLGDTAQGVYLLVDITVKNNGNKALDVSNDFFKIYQGDKEFTSDSGASLYANDNTGFFLEEINPGNSITSKVAIDVPQEVADATDLQLQVQTGAWGTQTARINLK